MATPTTVSELFPRVWLKSSDLGGRAVTVKIAGVKVEELRQLNGEKAPKVVLTFEGKKLRLACNKTQAIAIGRIAGSERFADWVGFTVVLSPGMAQNGKPTIIVGSEP